MVGNWMFWVCAWIQAIEKEVRAIRRRVGMVFQQFNLFHLSILDNITLAPVKVQQRSKQDAEQRPALLEQMGIGEQAHNIQPSSAAVSSNG